MKNTVKIRPGFVFCAQTGARPVGMGLPQTARVKLNLLRTGVG